MNLRIMDELATLFSAEAREAKRRGDRREARRLRRIADEISDRLDEEFRREAERFLCHP